MSLEQFSLKGKVVLITGGGRGLGRAMAEALASAGADLAITGRNMATLEEACRALKPYGGAVFPIVADVTRAEDAAALAEKAVSEFGGVDVLINNAGATVAKPLLEVSESEWDTVIDTNLKGTFLCTKAIGRHMVQAKRGKIINIASVSGMMGGATISAYCASKGAVIMFTKAMAKEWAKYNITVNALAPGYFHTDMTAAGLADPSIRNAIVAKIPMRRTGLPEELSGAIIFLASDASKFMTGSVLIIDGGQAAG